MRKLLLQELSALVGQLDLAIDRGGRDMADEEALRRIDEIIAELGRL